MLHHAFIFAGYISWVCFAGTIPNIPPPLLNPTHTNKRGYSQMSPIHKKRFFIQMSPTHKIQKEVFLQLTPAVFPPPQGAVHGGDGPRGRPGRGPPASRRRRLHLSRGGLPDLRHPPKVWDRMPNHVLRVAKYPQSPPPLYLLLPPPPPTFCALLRGMRDDQRPDHVLNGRGCKVTPTFPPPTPFVSFCHPQNPFAFPSSLVDVDSIL